MQLRLRVVTTAAEVIDLIVTSDATARVSDIARALAKANPAFHRAPESAETLTLVVSRPDGSSPTRLVPHAAIGDSGICSGSTVSLDAYPLESNRVGEVPLGKIHVFAGPDEGRMFSLYQGANTIGRSHNSDIILSDPTVSNTHATLHVGDKIALHDRGSANGTFVGASQIGSAYVSPHDVISIGDTEIGIELFEATENSHRAMNLIGTQVPYNRSPVITRQFEGTEVIAPTPPLPAKPQRFPILLMLAPALMGLAMYMVTRNPMSLLFIAMTPLMITGQYIERRLADRQRKRLERDEFEEALATLQKRAQYLRQEEIATRNAEVPSQEVLLATLYGQSAQLWSRRPDKENFLEIHLGAAFRPSRNSICLPTRSESRSADWERLIAIRDEFATVGPVPLTVKLRDCHSFGVGGSKQLRQDIARALVLQLVTLHSPSEVIVCALASQDTCPEWEWLKWLPHTASIHSPLPGPHLAADAHSAQSLVESIEGLLVHRESHKNSAHEIRLPTVVLLVEDDAPIERGRLVAIAENGAPLGVHVVWFADSQEQLPSACRAFLSVKAFPGPNVFGDTQSDSLIQVDSLWVTHENVRSGALCLSALTDSGAPLIDQSDLPRSVSFLSLVGSEIADDAQAIIGRWHESGSIIRGFAKPLHRRNDATLKAIVGQGTQYEYSLDLRTQGPHALVGGTTGSGKSEFLQAWVLSMAASHSPDRVTFLFVDYKGGAAFADCVELPHSVGLVTDLSPHLVRRALTSLRAELRYREHLLNRKKAKDLLALERTGDPETPPALVIVVDEFAALAKEFPEFVDGVVDIAQRGRSLGLHLILATQRPAGVIKDNLRANTNLRIALRMADQVDSADVLGDGLAADFDPLLPGRAAVRTGPGKISLFQAAYAGGRSSTKPTPPTIELETLTFGPGEKWDIPTDAPTDELNVTEDGPTDIARCVATIRAAATLATIPPPRKPWLPELPSTVDLLSLTYNRGQVPLGIVDSPEDQSQYVVSYCPDHDGNLAVFGASGAGKSTLLRSVALAAALGNSPEPVCVYALDFGAGALTMLEDLPHVASVIKGTDAERIMRLTKLLVEEIESRTRIFSEFRAESLEDYRTLSNNPHTPRIFVIIDGLAAFRDAYEGEANLVSTYESITRVMAEGRPLGIHVVVSIERPGALSSTLSAFFSLRLILRQADENAYLSLGVDKSILTKDSPPGRAVISSDQHEIQLGVIGGLGKPNDQAEYAKQVAEQLRHAGIQDVAPIERLEEVIPLSSILSDYSNDLPLLGIAEDTLGAVGFSPHGIIMLAGMPRSGRSTAVHCLSLSLRHWSKDIRMAYVGSPRSQAAGLEIWDDRSTNVESAAELAATLQNIARIPAGEEPGLVLVIEGLSDYLGTPAEQPLLSLIKEIRRNDHLVIAEGENSAWSSSWPLIAEVRNQRRGLVLQPDQIDGEALFRTPFPRMRRSDFPPGRGEFVDGGRLRRIQMPLPDL